MDVEFDDQLEAEYATQQEEELQQQADQDKGQELEYSSEWATVLVDISEMLRLLNEQMLRLNEVTQTVPEAVASLKMTTTAIQGIASELPITVQEQCLAEYKTVLENAVRNYNQMQKAAEKWQKSIEEKKQSSFRIVTASAIVTPALLVLLLILR